MLLVKTKIGPSKINGIGLFADQFIPQGTPVWKFQEGFDLEISETDLASLSAPARKQFLKYSYKNIETGKYILCFDDARFFNHANQPNCTEVLSTKEIDEPVDIAACDIQIGEELTCDYKTFDGDFNNKINTQ